MHKLGFMSACKCSLNSCDNSFVNGTNDREAYQEHWIAVLVQMNCEKKAATRLGKIGYETYIPTQQEVHQWSDRKKKVDRLIMPMVIFVRATVREEKNGSATNRTFTNSWHYQVVMKIRKDLPLQYQITKLKD